MPKARQLRKVSVWDNGIGIPEGRQTEIFKNYVQVDNPERNREKGFGLGLSIARGLANLLGHKLNVDSTPGRGSRFSVTVPFIGLIPPELIEVQTGEDGDPDLTNMVVAIIEDNSDLRIEISMRLIEHGCYVVAGESSYDVIEQLRIEALTSGPHFILRLPVGTRGRYCCNRGGSRCYRRFNPCNPVVGRYLLHCAQKSSRQWHEAFVETGF